MRQFFMLTLLALAAGVMPAMVRADISNQEAALKIRDQLNKSGQLALGDEVGVRCLNGTVCLEGHIRDQEHLNKVLGAVFSTEGIIITQVVHDHLVVDGGRSVSETHKMIAGNDGANPLRGASEKAAADVNRAQPLPTSFNQGHSTTRVQMVQPVPTPPPAPIPVAPVAAPGSLPAAESASGVAGAPLPMYAQGAAVGGAAPVRYDRPSMPGYAWPSYAAYPNYAAVTYPKQYSPTAWPYIGPFYPYPQVPLGWRKVSLEWDDGWWWLDFKDKPRCCWWR